MMGGRRAAVLLLLLLSAVASVMIPLAAAQNPQGTTAVQQNPGLLERLMTQYVYPIRDYDWRAMIRNLIDNVMNYISPTTKEPKAGYGAADRTAVLVRRALHRAVHYVESLLN